MNDMNEYNYDKAGSFSNLSMRDSHNFRGNSFSLKIREAFKLFPDDQGSGLIVP